jgi:hypothetical protein
MPAHKKHATDWFTTDNFRCINLNLIAEVKLYKENGTVQGAHVLLTVPAHDGQTSILVTAADAVRIFDRLC